MTEISKHPFLVAGLCNFSSIILKDGLISLSITDSILYLSTLALFSIEATLVVGGCQKINHVNNILNNTDVKIYYSSQMWSINI